ncbi:sushi, von Willebrand factor type A, EGF and pentraxin domain-containing protein 1-like [Mercenaria mercenaria]|uniref:sushi, von Willebrand factor type A, EGF and pentraxin domain-containing protein 1-like n=1 Tax=Mercenaria mercenaria TaxID=6596 RepID=UPI00234E3AF0|nr:sushi, von Willebrand factor type A, EGF and pentraxin domain-containing protein 1-like [Mercenaria mercenaria]
MFYILIFVVSGIHGFQFQKNDLRIKYEVSSFKTCAVIPNSLILSLVPSVSLNDCVWHCAFRSTCTGLNYKKKFPLCELYTGNEVQEKLGNCVYIKRRDIEVEHSQCDLETNGGMTCDIPGSNTVKECPYPDVANGKPMGNVFSIGSKQTIECNPGYVIHDTNTLTCLANGTWEVLRGSWKECSKPVIQNAEVELNICTKPSMTLATVRCDTHYISNKTTDAKNVITEETISCDKSGTWSPSIDCIVNNNIQNVAMDKPANQSSTYHNHNAHLATDGIWNTENSDTGKACSYTDVYVEDTTWWEVNLLQAYSIRQLKILNRDSECPYPDVANGKSSGNEFSIGSKQTIECNPGYVIHDTNELKCLENGTWEVIRGSWKGEK